MYIPLHIACLLVSRVATQGINEREFVICFPFHFEADGGRDGVQLLQESREEDRVMKPESKGIAEVPQPN